jgi:hypothetical protein
MSHMWPFPLNTRRWLSLLNNDLQGCLVSKKRLSYFTCIYILPNTGMVPVWTFFPQYRPCALVGACCDTWSQYVTPQKMCDASSYFSHFSWVSLIRESKSTDDTRYGVSTQTEKRTEWTGILQRPGKLLVSRASYRAVERRLNPVRLGSARSKPLKRFC